MTAREAILYLEDARWNDMRLGLDRTRALLKRLGEPQKKLRFVHVAGTNGKGSACAMLASVLRCAGYKTGLYTSPYVCRFHERIQIDGADIPDEALGAVTEQVRAAADAMPDHPSQFELVTAAALAYFAREGCDIVVLEVGLGGALDSTNVIDPPECAVIMNIGLEHTEYLGDTLEKIAAAKAGIIKPGCDAVCYRGAPEVERVFAETCARQGARLTLADFGAIRPGARSLAGQSFSWRGQRDLFLPLLGEHQLRNAAVVLETAEVLARRGWRVSEQAVRDGLARTVWPARFEVLSRAPLFAVDGGHNPQCAEAMAGLLRDYWPEGGITFLTGVLADKNYRRMLDYLQPFAARFLCVTPDNPRALPAEDLAAAIRARGLPAETCASPEAGVDRAAGSGAPAVAFGSLYMAGRIRARYLEKWR